MENCLEYLRYHCYSAFISLYYFSCIHIPTYFCPALVITNLWIFSCHFWHSHMDTELLLFRSIIWYPSEKTKKSYAGFVYIYQPSNVYRYLVNICRTFFGTYIITRTSFYNPYHYSTAFYSSGCGRQTTLCLSMKTCMDNTKCPFCKSNANIVFEKNIAHSPRHTKCQCVIV